MQYLINSNTAESGWLLETKPTYRRSLPTPLIIFSVCVSFIKYPGETADV